MTRRRLTTRPRTSPSCWRAARGARGRLLAVLLAGGVLAGCGSSDVPGKVSEQQAAALSACLELKTYLNVVNTNLAGQGPREQRLARRLVSLIAAASSRSGDPALQAPARSLVDDLGAGRAVELAQALSAIDAACSSLG